MHGLLMYVFLGSQLEHVNKFKEAIIPNQQFNSDTSFEFFST